MNKQNKKLLIFLLRSGGRLNIGMIYEQSIHICMDALDCDLPENEQILPNLQTPEDMLDDILFTSRDFVNKSNLRSTEHRGYIYSNHKIIGLGVSLDTSLTDFLNLKIVKQIYKPEPEPKKTHHYLGYVDPPLTLTYALGGRPFRFVPDIATNR